MSLLRRPLAAVAAAAVFAALPLGAFAQATVAIPAPQKHACTKPGEHPGKLATDNQIRTWTRSANAYLECVKKFIGEQQAAAKPYQDAGRVHIEAGNAAVEEFNAAVRDFKEQQDKAAPD